ncbi:MAG: type 4a pilus biogenesis protein PilO [Patescibacteria group bacterium]|jgi:Tfp pilus assembly protein PilO
MINYRVVLITIIYIAILGGGTVFGIKPFVSGVNNSITELKNKNQQYIQSQDKLNDLIKLNKSQTDITQAQNITTLAIPKTPDYDTLLLTLETLANSHQLKVNDINLSPLTSTTKNTAATTASTSSYYKELTGSMSVNGTYPNIKLLLTESETLDRILTITSVTIIPTESDANNLSADIKFSFYYVK